MITIGLHNAWFVLRTTEHGLFAWRVKCVVNKGNRILSFKGEAGTPNWECLHITDLKGWMVYETEAVPPCAATTKDNNGQSLGVVVKVVGQPMTFLRQAALKAFKGMTCQFCSRMIKFLEIHKTPTPTLEADIVMTLLQETLPDKTDAELLEIMPQRHLMKISFNTSLTPEMVTQTSDILGDSTTKEMTNEIMTYVKKVQAQQNLLPKAKADPKKAKKTKVLAEKDFESWQAAQKYKPQVADCVLSMETEWHCRWKITYPRELPPYSNQCPFDDKDPISKRKALYTVLRWVWAEHLAAHPNEVCPWNLDD